MLPDVNSSSVSRKINNGVIWAINLEAGTQITKRKKGRLWEEEEEDDGLVNLNSEIPKLILSLSPPTESNISDLEILVEILKSWGNWSIYKGKKGMLFFVAYVL